MMTVESLRAFGADVDNGLTRCMGNEALYIRLVGMAIADANFENLGKALEAGDLEAGFSAAHALKGILANLELTPILDPVKEIVEPLRRRESDYNYADLYKVIMDKLAQIKALDA